MRPTEPPARRAAPAPWGRGLVTVAVGVLGALGVLAVVGCSATSPTSSTGPDGSATTAAGGVTPGTGMASGTLTIPAAASLTEPFTAIRTSFEAANPGVTDVAFSFDSSSRLAEQIRQGAPADVFASADEASMATLVDAGLVAGTPQVFARNQLAIVVKAGNPRRVRGLADLASVGTVSLCGSEVPCGRYADQVLQRAGVSIPVDTVTRGPNAKATLGAVADGDADAGIVYVTDVTGDRVEAVSIPADQNAVASYPIAVLAEARNPGAAQAFVAQVLGPDGQAALRAAGFLPPS